MEINTVFHSLQVGSFLSNDIKRVEADKRSIKSLTTESQILPGTFCLTEENCYLLVVLSQQRMTPVVTGVSGCDDHLLVNDKWKWQCQSQ